MEITELICILKVVISAVFVVTFPGCLIIFPPTVILTLVGSSVCGITSTTMREYANVHPTGILLRATKRIVLVPFFTFPGNPSASLPNCFDHPFCQRYLVSFSSDFIRYLYCRTSPVYVSITVLTRYHGKGSSSICVAILCVAIRIVGAI